MNIFRILSTLGFLSLTFTSSARAAITVAVNNANFTKSANGIGEFIFEVLQVELSGKTNYELVDRKRLQDMLSEQSLGASGLTAEQAAKVGKLVGARYYVFGETLQAGERTAVNCRVVQVDTGVLKPIMLPIVKEEDPMAAGQKLAGQVADAIAKLEGRTNKEADQGNVAMDLGLAADAKRPSIAFRIPETSVTPQTRTADPAAEKALESFFLSNGFKLVQLSRPSQSVPNTATPRSFLDGLLGAATSSSSAHLEGKDHEALLQEARDKGVDVIILGIATSDLATQIGSFIAARARVEMVAIRTKDSLILASGSGYGVGTDLSNFVAEKKAIESATQKIQAGFAKQFLERINKS